MLDATTPLLPAPNTSYDPDRGFLPNYGVVPRHVVEDPARARTGTFRPAWSHMDFLRVAGTGERVPVVAGLYWDQGGGLGTYFSADGRSYLTNEHGARVRAEAEGVDIDVRWAGEHTGAVHRPCVRYGGD